MLYFPASALPFAFTSSLFVFALSLTLSPPSTSIRRSYRTAPFSDTTYYSSTYSSLLFATSGSASASASASASGGTTTTTTTINTNSLSFSSNKMKVETLARYPIKGLAPDVLSKVCITCDDFIPTFPDDRRFALLQQKKTEEADSTSTEVATATTTAKFDPSHPKWIHKEHFLCAFTEPEFMAKFNCEYRIISEQEEDENEDEKVGNSSSLSLYSHCLPNDHAIPMKKSRDQAIQRMLTIYQRQYINSETESEVEQDPCSPQILLGPIDLSTSSGNQELEQFFMKQYDIERQTKNDENEIEMTKPISSSPLLKCISADTDTERRGQGQGQGQGQHVHQFGNTRSGVKFNNNDTRTIHIINAETVKELSSKIGIDINPMRFRPNLVVSGLEPWKEFDFVGKTLKIVSSHDRSSNNNGNGNRDDGKGVDSDGNGNGDADGMTIKVLSTTVRCAGVGIDPSEHPTEQNKLDIPKLLNEHYPQFGPYLGVYATIRTAGSICIGDTMELILDAEE